MQNCVRMMEVLRIKVMDLQWAARAEASLVCASAKLDDDFDDDFKPLCYQPSSFGMDPNLHQVMDVREGDAL